MITAPDHVQLTAPTGSEAVLRAFYTKALGMTETPKPPEPAVRSEDRLGLLKPLDG
ncbi:hypothetical protein ACFU99_35910 [Streptomyces sp. NPDC057654]|uniref:hypothetical protein n=1 Tax=Streptomyces sp. NPDC057654 TaxID=3346196 RepID=UPI0036A6ED9E